MSGSAPKFNVAIQASAVGTPELKELQATVAKLQASLVAAGLESKKVAQATGWGRITGAIGRADGALGGLTGSVGALHGRLAGLLPPLAALGGLGALGGVFTLTEHVAAATAEFVHTSEKLGIAGKDLARFNFVAKMTDTSVESLHTGIGRLGANIAGAAMGKSKPLAQLFHQMGISLRDSRGEIRGVGDVMGDIMKSFRLNENPATRDYLAKTLFGRGGIEIIPMLAQSREELARLFDEFDRLRFVASDADRSNLLQYHRDWMMLEFAVSQLQRQIGAALAPVLDPIVRQMTEWVAQNREWVATGIAGAVKDFADAAGKIDWAGVVTGMRDWAQFANRFVDVLGGWKTLFEIYFGWKAIAGIAAIANGFRAIEAAALGAAAAEEVEAAARSAGLLRRGLGLGAGVLGGVVAPAVAAAYVMRPFDTQGPEVDDPRNIARYLHPNDRRGHEGEDAPPLPSIDPRRLSRQIYEDDRANAANARHPLSPTGLARVSRMQIDLNVTGLPDGVQATAEVRGDDDARLSRFTFGPTGRAFGNLPGG